VYPYLVSSTASVRDYGPQKKRLDAFTGCPKYRPKKHCLGLSYVAISRVKALDRLMFESPFDFSRFTVHNTPVARDQELDSSVINQIL
jgi:hypothetical protein